MTPSFLLDTHALLWFAGSDSKLSRSALDAIQSGTPIYVSVASLWEIAIKTNLSKLKLDEPLDVFVKRHVTDNAMSLLPIEVTHCLAVQRLQSPHRDPFDRMLACQAIAENMRIVTIDPAIASLGAETLW